MSRRAMVATTDLLELAQHQRDANLGVLLGDLRRAGYDVTRWEFYASPFRIELSDELREQLSGHWKEREPRTDEWSAPSRSNRFFP